MTPTYNTPNAAGTKKEPKKLSFKMFGYFIGFTVFVILLLWLFQALLLDPVYRTIKLQDMKRCADYISDVIVEDDMENGIVEASGKYNNCIAVYTIENNKGTRIASSHIQTTCMIHNLSSDSILNEMYEEAKDGKYYVKHIELSVGDRDMPVVSSGTANKHPSAVICSKVINFKGSDYLILIDSEIMPLMSTTRTLMYQLTVITVILLIAAAVMSYFISKRIAGPFSEMSDQAGKLATGNYDVCFDNDSFLEAKQLADTLNYAADELSKLDTMQKELIANISHDLRTPLTLISGYGEVMRDIPGEMTSDNMQIILDETARLSSLVNDLLEISKLTDGAAVVSKEKFSLTELIKETLGRYTKLVEKDGYTIDFKYDEDVTVNADKTRLLQVIYNLINNAINYTGEDKLVTVEQTVSEGKVRVSVIDSGDGIPPEQLPMIWERYYKVHDYHKRGKIGSGLGLSIVKKVLLLHEAHFGVTSKIGSGSAFWFELDIEDITE